MNESYSPVAVDELSLRSLKTLTNEVAIQDSNEYAYTGSGSSNSPFRTRGLDFQEIRAYQPGDDIRQIDWRTTAKHGKPFTKLYTDEKERPVYFICDMRSAMKFASHGDFKSVVAARITMLLAWMVEQKKDKIGALVLMPDQIKVVDMNRRSGTEGLISNLVASGTPQADKTDETTMDQALLLLAREAKKGAMIFIAGDFHDFTTESVKILDRIKQNRTIALIQIYDEMESILPYGFWTMTNGSETATVDMTNKANRDSFETAFQNRLTFIKETASSNGWDYVSVKTTDDYLNLLLGRIRNGGL